MTLFNIKSFIEPIMNQFIGYKLFFIMSNIETRKEENGSVKLFCFAQAFSLP